MDKLIKTHEDHDRAITRLAELMDRDPPTGTVAADRLELLAHLIEDYEKKHHDIGLPDPLAAINFRMEQQGLKRRDLVPFLGSPSRVSEMLGGKRPLTLPMIRKLHEGLGIPIEALVREAKVKLPSRVKVVRPALGALKEMCKRGYFAGVERWDKAKNHVDELLEELFSFGSGLVAVPVFNRQMPRKEAIQDAGALIAWQARVLQVASGRKLAAAFDLDSITPNFLRQLAGLSRHSNGPVLAVEMLENHGIPVVVERHLPATWLDGAALRLANGTPVIGLTLRHDRLDNFWFCLFHELGHVVRHIAKDKADSFLDDLDAPSQGKCEREADQFARSALIADRDWTAFWEAGVFDHITVRREAKRLLIDGSILAGRIRLQKKNFEVLTSLVGHGRVRKHFM